MNAFSKSSSNLYSIISIAIVLFLLAIYALIFLHSSNVSNLIKEKINIIVELNDDSGREEIKTLLNNIEQMEGVRSRSVEFIPKEKAMVLMKEFLSGVSDPSSDLPFKDVVVFNLNAKDYSETLIKSLSQTIEKDPSVLSIYSENETVNLVKDNIKSISFVTLVIGLIFVLLAVAIVYNTIRLKLHSDRLEIKTMQLVGATRVFIAKPYIKEATFIGLGAFGIVFIFLSILISMLLLSVPSLSEIINWIYTLIALVVTLAVSLLLTVGIARFVVKSYLDAKTSELI